MVRISSFLIVSTIYKNNIDLHFEKSIAHIIKMEAKETGNKFVVLFHSLNHTNEDIDLLVKEMNEEGIAVMTFSKYDSVQMLV